jgi:hypothetical protein
MKLKEALQVVKATTGYVTIAMVEGGEWKEITRKNYQFKDQDLLNRNVKNICQQDGEMVIILWSQNSLDKAE